MASESETVADAIDAVRKMIHDCPAIKGGMADFEYQLKANGAIDRIEAAHRREVAELRECLKEATGCADEFQKFFETHPYLCKYTRDVIKKSKKALEGMKDDSPSCEDN